MTAVGRERDHTNHAEGDWNGPIQHAGAHRPGPIYALITTCLLAGANGLAITGFRLPFLGPAIGFWFIAVLPVYLLATTSLWGRASMAERVGYSLGATLLLLMSAGLAMNTVLPLLEIRHPLGTVPVVMLADVLNVALYLLRRRFPATPSWSEGLRTVGPAEARLITMAAACAALAVLGANRLNNDAGDQVSLAALGGVLLTLVLLLCWRRQVRDGMASVTIYLVSLALLLMTSLRGWFVTGHDIQTEYRVFQLTEAHGHWVMSSFRNAYNACLSITILPTELGRVAGIDSPYVFKALFQIIFAACPVLVYAISRRYWSQLVSILAVVYFVSFPTFFNDMPFLNRQEIAYLFVCAGVLAVTNTAWSRHVRRAGLVVAAAGVELSHYSTMYVFLLTLATAWAVRHLGAFSRAIVSLVRRASARTSPVTTGRTVGAGSLLAVITIAFLWGNLATQTTSGALADAASAISALTGHSGSRSDDTSYSLLFGATTSPQKNLGDYRQQTLQERIGASPGTYVPLSVTNRYPTTVVNEPALLPVTTAGRILTDAGVPVEALNDAVRQGAAKGEQLFVGIGLIACLSLARLRRRIAGEFICLCVGSLAMVVVITVLPNLSSDYGVLRAFQEALILIAPVLVAGSFTALRPLGRWAPGIAAALCLLLFTSTTGLMPQLLGGYPAQLNLNNSGSYYDIYYVHPQEVAAVAWLAGKPGVLPDGVQSDYIPARFAFSSPADVTGQQVIGDIYPTLVRQSSWLILGYSAVHTGLVTTFYNGDLITYRYPAGFFQVSKNLVYNNGGTEIYK